MSGARDSNSALHTSAETGKSKRLMPGHGRKIGAVHTPTHSCTIRYRTKKDTGGSTEVRVDNVAGIATVPHSIPAHIIRLEQTQCTAEVLTLVAESNGPERTVCLSINYTAYLTPEDVC